MSALTAAEAVGRARELTPAVAERADKTETARALLAETVAELTDAGLFHLLQPARFGGPQLGFDVVQQVTTELGQGCGSTSWCTMILNTGTLVAAFPEPAQVEVWGDTPKALVGAVFAPSPHFRAVDGGYELRGRWPFASAVDHARWMVVSGLSLAGGPPEISLCLVPAEDYRIEDDWFVSGLRGSGSKSVVIDEPLFVPSHRVASFSEIREGRAPGSQLHNSPLYRIPVAASFASGGIGPGVGIALGAYTSWREWTRDRVAFGVQRVADWPATQMKLGEAGACIDTARLLALHDLVEVQAAAAAGQQIDVPMRARIQRNAAFAATLLVRAVDTLFAGSGATGLHDGPIQRAWRDIHAVAAHLSLRWESQAEHFGRVEFGRGPGNPVFY